MYAIIRKHSSDNNPSTIEKVSTKSAARQIIKNEIAELAARTNVQHTIGKIGDVTNIKFDGCGGRVIWSIGYWFEKI
jgi:ribosomal protein S11